MPLDPALSDERHFNLFNGRALLLSKAYRHQTENEFHKKGELNYVFHHAVRFRSILQWGNPYVAIMPRRYFTPSGFDPYPDSRAIKNLDATFRNRPQDRNPGQLTELNNWKDILFGDPHAEPFFESNASFAPRWIRRLGAGDLLEFKVNWRPESSDKSSSSLQEFAVTP